MKKSSHSVTNTSLAWSEFDSKFHIHLAAIAEVEKSFLFLVFGGLAHRRMERLRMLCRIHTPKHRRVILAFRMLQRARSRKEAILRRQRSERNFDELHWVSRDIAAMLSEEQFKIPFNTPERS